MPFGRYRPRGALLPFGFIESEAGRQAVRAIADRLEDMQAETRRLVAEGDRPARAVIVWDGYSDFTGRRLDTVFVEAYEAGAAGGILIAQSYRSVGLVKKRTEIVGQGGVIARGRPPLF
jgi:hypothetical protein